ncbi:VOC family protein [Pseudomonas sp. S 311-6]|uniref:VOC family protein n=1 Tax=Kerstersia gyiorum TaxID=206506 RepID=UPI0020984CBF|nr:VOC family protein [Pseudomonas sp. S 311-6]
MNPQNGLPGLQHVDHVSLTVTDMDAASAFYCNTFGGTELYRLGPFDAREFPRQPDGRTTARPTFHATAIRVSAISPSRSVTWMRPLNSCDNAGCLSWKDR